MEKKNDRLIALRQQAGWTQAELAEKVALSQSMIAHIEAGKKDPSRKYRLRLARLFGVTVEWLFYEQYHDDAMVNEATKGEEDVELSEDARLSAHS